MFFNFAKKRCKAITSKGRRCKAIRINNSDHCYNHQKYTPKRFDILKRYLNQIKLSVILALVIFLYQFFTSPTKKDINEEHGKTRNEIKKVEESVDELKLLIEKLLMLPVANKAIINNFESYASKKVSDYSRMDSLLNANSENLKTNFPKGFALFSSDESGVILPLNEMPVFENLIIKWDKTKMKELTKTEFLIRFPDFIDTKFNSVFTNISIGGGRIKHRMYGGFKVNNIEPVVMILEDFGSQIVFVVSYI